MVAPHNAQGPFGTVRGTCTIEDGYIVVPDGPGLGVELDAVAPAAYPYHEKNFLRLFEPG